MDVRRGFDERVGPDPTTVPRQGLRFPDFLGIGAQKAGTTWLHRNLVGHPDVWLPPVKELHYFDQLYVSTPEHQTHAPSPSGHRRRPRADDRRRERAEQALAQLDRPATDDRSVASRAAELIATGIVSDDWYGSIFALAPSSAICGEVTPSYALLPEDGIAHVVALNPDVKILFLVRDPIDRAVAHLQMFHQRRDPHDEGQLELLRILEVDSRFLSRSRYSETLRRYRRHVDEQAIWIGDFDRLAGAPEELLHSVCAFLGVEFDARFFPEMNQRFNVGVARDLGDAVYKRLKDALEPEYDALAQIVPEAASRWRQRHYG